MSIFLQAVIVASPPPDLFAPVKCTLQELEVRLNEASSDALVHNASSVRSRFEEIRDHLPESAVAALHSVAFIEFKLYDYKKAKKNPKEKRSANS